MSKRYAPDHKHLALKIMQDFKWDIVKTAIYTGIPARTLREWKRECRERAARSRAIANSGQPMPKRQIHP